MLLSTVALPRNQFNRTNAYSQFCSCSRIPLLSVPLDTGSFGPRTLGYI